MYTPEKLLEPRLHKLLRRVDWRFLLPTPSIVKSICFAKGLIKEAVDLVSESVCEPGSGVAAECDLAVALNPDAATLNRAFLALCPGGTCYIELYYPQIMGVKGIRHKLEAAGFQNVQCYWAWPSPLAGKSLYWLPLETNFVQKYFISTRLRAKTMPQRLAQAFLHKLWLGAMHVNLLIPICVTARKPELLASTQLTAGDKKPLEARGAVDSQLLPDYLSEEILNNWQKPTFNQRSSQLCWFLMCMGGYTYNKVIGFVLSDQDKQPKLAIKMSRTADATAGLRREAQALHFLEVLQEVTGVPGVIFYKEYASVGVQCQTFLAGLRLSDKVQPDNYRELALKTTDWLVKLACASQTKLSQPSDWWQRLVEPVFKEFSTAFGSIADPGLLEETQAILNTLSDMALVFVHGDFVPANLQIAADGNLEVLDWESAEYDDLPAHDLIYYLTFLTHLYTTCINPDKDLPISDSYRLSLNSASYTGSITGECLERYTKTTGLNPENLRPLRLLVWMKHANNEYKKIASLTGTQPGKESLGKELFFSLWREELSASAVGREPKLDV